MDIKPVFEHSNVLSQQAVQVRAGVSLSANLSLTTQEGDRVQISFGSEQSISGSRSQSRSAEGAVVQRLSLTAIAAARYSISVEGDLNGDELNAIQRLVKQIDPLASDFFAGRKLDLKNAAGTLADNMGVVQELALHLEKSVSASVAVSQSSRQPQVEGKSHLPLPQSLPDLNHIRDFPALVQSVLDSVFSAHAAGLLDDASVVQTFGDFLQFLKERLHVPGEGDPAASTPQTPSAAAPQHSGA